MSTKVSTSMPCLNPFRRATQETQTAYLTEFWQNCEKKDDVEVVDNRFKQLNFSISQFDLENESKVLQKLEEKPLYTVFVFPGSSLKTQNMLYFYQRPTIGFSLECELKGKTREKLIEMT